jgi:LCP family protein required for cell wall assembly
VFCYNEAMNKTSAADFKRKPGGRRLARTLKRIFIGLLAVVVLYLGYIIIQIGINPFDAGSLSADSSGRTNVLILGVGGTGHDGGQLSDTNLVVSLDKSSKSVGLISVPRDLRVFIPGYYSAKINTANALGGPVLAEQTMSDVLNLPMHYYMQVDFSALKNVVDALGGVKVEVKKALIDPEYPCDENQYRSCGLAIKPGVYNMDGAMALAYTRCRKGSCGDDFGRAERQQEILKLIKAKILSPAVILNPWKLGTLVGIWRSHIVTNMTANNVVRMVWAMSHSKRNVSLVLDTSLGGYLRSVGGSDLIPVEGNFRRIQSDVLQMFTRAVVGP